MRRMRIIKCEACKFYKIDDPKNRCIHKDNVYENWLGVCYKQSPDHKNYKGECEYYEKMDCDNADITIN